MKQYVLTVAVALIGSAVANAEQQSSATIDGKAITVKYSAPTTKNRAFASFKTESDLAFKGVHIPKGEYTVYVLADGQQWQLAVNKATGPKAAAYDPKLDLDRIPLTMSKPGSTGVPCKITLTKIAALAAKLQVEWNDDAGSASFHLDRGASDSEW